MTEQPNNNYQQQSNNNYQQRDPQDQRELRGRGGRGYRGGRGSRGGRGGFGGRGSFGGRGGRGGRGREHVPGVTNVIDDGALNLRESLINDPTSQIEILQNDTESPLYPMRPFDEIIKDTSILQTIDDLEFYQPSKIQSQAIPILNDNPKKDLVAQAQSGSGKTIAFLVSMLLHVDPHIKQLQTICLCHTRELAKQTFSVFGEMNKYTNFKGCVCVKDNEEPASDAQLVFGTPTSVQFFIKNNTINASKVNLLIVDEADTILEWSSSHRPSTINLIKNLLPSNIQFGFFSATFPNNVIDTIKKLKPDIVQIRLKRSEQTVKTISHWYTNVQNENETKDVISDLLKVKAQGQTFIFVGRKVDVPDITRHLKEKGFAAEGFSSDCSANERDQILKKFREQEILVVVTTDVLSHGIDIPTTYLVINVGIPRMFNKNTQRSFPDCDTYTHRAGRAGRYGRTGLCFTIISNPKDEYVLKDFCSTRQLNITLHKIDRNNLKDLPEEEKEEYEEEEDEGENATNTTQEKQDKQEEPKA